MGIWRFSRLGISININIWMVFKLRYQPSLFFDTMQWPMYWSNIGENIRRCHRYSLSMSSLHKLTTNRESLYTIMTLSISCYSELCNAIYSYLVCMFLPSWVIYISWCPNNIFDISSSKDFHSITSPHNIIP